MKRTLLDTPGLILFLALGLLGACSQQMVKYQPPVRLTDEASLIKGSMELYDHTVLYQFPFVLDTVNRDAQLTLDFVVTDYAHCPISYVPTTVMVNNKLVQEIDFRKFEFDTRHVINIKVDQSILKTGINHVEIRTGECAYDIDAMSLNDMRIKLQK